MPGRAVLARLLLAWLLGCLPGSATAHHPSEVARAGGHRRAFTQHA